MAKQVATNVTWHDGEISRDDRYQILRQKGATIWFTGLSGSGKSTIAVALEKALHSMGKLSYRLDGDNVRLGINKNLGFSEADRKENIRRIGEVAKLMMEAGMIVMTAFISPFRDDREIVRNLMPHGDFLEIFCNADLDICEDRDVKGHYKKARAGEIKNYTGIDSPYEKPLKPELSVDTGSVSLEESVDLVLGLLKERLIVK